VLDRIRTRRRRKAIVNAQPLVAQDDDVRAVLGLAKGPGNALFGADLALVVTDQDVIMLGRSAWTLRRHPPRSYLRSEVTVEAWEPSSRWSNLKLGTPDGVADLRVDRIHHNEAAEVAELLSPSE
jgi:hypothetical protein